MKKLRIILAVMLIFVTIGLVSCDKKPAKTYELISIKIIDETIEKSLTITDINYFYLTFNNKLTISLSYVKLLSEQENAVPSDIAINDTVSFKVSKDKKHYTFKSDLFKGDLVVENATIESFVNIDNIDYKVIFVLKQ